MYIKNIILLFILFSFVISDVIEQSNDPSFGYNDNPVSFSIVPIDISDSGNSNSNKMNNLNEMYDNCIFNDSNYYYNLSPLKGISFNFTENRGFLFNYFFSICSKNEICDLDKDLNIQSCQFISTGEFFINGISNERLPFNLKENEIIISYESYNIPGQIRQSNIIISCEHGVEHHFEKFEESPLCTYNYYIKSKYACLPNLNVDSSFICESIEGNGLKITNRDEDIFCYANGPIKCLNDDNTQCQIDQFGKVIFKNQTEHISCFGDQISCGFNNFSCSSKKTTSTTKSTTPPLTPSPTNDFINKLNYLFDQNDLSGSNNNFNLISINLIILFLISLLLK
ncbi:hypothetical protein ACTA71_004022 [Dictyostelium dimigraforme]